jgi:N-acetylmuramate 1-kinase
MPSADTPSDTPSIEPTAVAIAWSDAARKAAFNTWLNALQVEHGLVLSSLRSASADASFRRYFRVDVGAASSHAPSTRSLIVMDAPPPHEDVRPFVTLAERMQAAGLHGPRVLAADAAQGFLLLSDLGTTLALKALQQANAAQADALMRAAIDALVQWQLKVSSQGLAVYDDALLQREMALFPEWCVQREHGLHWTDAQQQTWQRLTRTLADRALAQATVTVHRDWMPRNLMLGPGPIGILDFQDAVHGPISYDVASLLRDAFWSWDEAREIDWAARYWGQARAAGLPVPSDFAEFWQDLEWMGLQRHLKVLGIFCRLKHRDGKPAYAQDLPRFFAYATKVAQRYGALRPLLGLIEPMSGTVEQHGFSMR